MSTCCCVRLTKKFTTDFNGQKFQQLLLSFCLSHVTDSSPGSKVGGKERKERSTQTFKLSMFTRAWWRMSGMLLAAVFLSGAVDISWATPGVQGSWWPPPSCSGAWPAACGVALQITACNLSAFEIIPVFLRIKFNPDRSSEPVYGSVPRAVVSPQPRGEQTLAREHPRAGPPRASSVAETSDLDMHGPMAEERLALVLSNFYRFHCLLVWFAWNHLTVFIKPKKVWKSGVCRYPHLQRTILCSSSK